MIDHRVFKWISMCEQIDFSEYVNYAAYSELHIHELILIDDKARMIFFDLLPQEVRNDLNYVENTKVNEYLYQISLYVL